MSVNGVVFTFVLLFAVGQTQEDQIHNRCLQPFKSSLLSKANYSTHKFISTALVNASETDNLLEQMTHNPCIEIEFEGSVFLRSKHIVVYGTCNLERMFRFVLHQSTTSKCWNMQLKVWEPALNLSCKQLPLTDAYSIHWSTILGSEIQLGSTNESLIQNIERQAVWLWYVEANPDGSRVIPNYADKFNDAKFHIVDRSECSGCRGNLSNTIANLHYKDTWNAHCGQMAQVRAEYVLYFETISCLCMAIVLIGMILMLMIVLYR